MTTAEWAAFLTVLGFVGYALEVALTVYRVVWHNGPPSDYKRAHLCFGMFVIALAVISVTAALTRPPFGGIMGVTEAQYANGLTVWMMAIATGVGALWRT